MNPHLVEFQELQIRSHQNKAWAEELGTGLVSSLDCRSFRSSFLEKQSWSNSISSRQTPIKVCSFCQLNVPFQPHTPMSTCIYEDTQDISVFRQPLDSLGARFVPETTGAVPLLVTDPSSIQQQLAHVCFVRNSPTHPARANVQTGFNLIRNADADIAWSDGSTTEARLGRPAEVAAERGSLKRMEPATG